MGTFIFVTGGGCASSVTATWGRLLRKGGISMNKRRITPFSIRGYFYLSYFMGHGFRKASVEFYDET